MMTAIIFIIVFFSILGIFSGNILIGFITGIIVCFSIVIYFKLKERHSKKKYKNQVYSCLKILYPNLPKENYPTHTSTIERNLRHIRREARMNNYVKTSQLNFVKQNLAREEKIPISFIEFKNFVTSIEKNRLHEINKMNCSPVFMYVFMLYAEKNTAFRIDLWLNKASFTDIVKINKNEIISFGKSLYKEKLSLPEWIDDESTSEGKFLCVHPLSENDSTIEQILRIINS